MYEITVEDMKPIIPGQFFNGLESRTKLLHQILDKLNDDRVAVVALFGMPGTGKTTLAEEVYKRRTDAFSVKVMVQVSDGPDIVRIQATIAESIDLPLHDIGNVAQRAIRLYNKLISMDEEKILIILDNVCKKLNLHEVGIPCTAKLLITTRDRVVCEVMNVHDDNTLEVGLMNTNEASELFKHQAGNQVDSTKYTSVVERLLSSCGGLPLAIVTTASSLKDKDLPSWEKFADDLEKTVTNDIHHNSILDMSYNLIKVKEQRIFFLLACLSSPIGSSVSIGSVMRFGIGLNLFQHVNKLSEAVEQAETWSNELIVSSLLQEGDVKGEAKIHDIVRAFAILFAAQKEGHTFMVEGIPGWPDNKSFEECTGMSLLFRSSYSRLNGVEGRRLRILILKGDMSPDFHDSFFKEMGNLEVLALSNMNFQPNLPKSIWKLKKLRTLCMEGCKLGDIKQICELVDLLVLSLRESFLEYLPSEICELSNLRLLDLSGCTSSHVPLITADVLGRLSKLEGLYLFHNKPAIPGFETKVDDKRSVVEDTKLPSLNDFEIRVANPNELQIIDAQSLINVDKFKVYVGNKRVDNESLQYCCVLNLRDIDELTEALTKPCLKVLVQKADCLMIKSSKGMENIVPQLDEEGFRDLSSLKIGKSSDVKCIVNGHEMNGYIAFPSLRSLYLRELVNLKTVCDGEAPQGMFSNLQTLRLHHMEELLYGIPFVPRNLNEICVSFCELLNFIFIENEETQVIELPFLKILKLIDMTRLLSLVGPKQLLSTCDTLQTDRVFFDGKIALPSLELFEMEGCDNVVKLWSKEIHISSLQNLKDIKIESCKKLLSLGPPSLFSVLLHLQTLSIKSCYEMREFITLEESEESETSDRVIRFPQLKYLDLESLGRLESFYAGRLELEFPKLTRLKLSNLYRMKRFASLEKSSALFHENIKFPCLEELVVSHMCNYVNQLCGWKALNFAPMLRHLTLENTGLRCMPSAILYHLSSITLIDFENDYESSPSCSYLQAKDGCKWLYSEMPNLKALKIENSESLKELFIEGDPQISEAIDFSGQIKTLELSCLPSLKQTYLHFFWRLVSLTLSGLNWDYASNLLHWNHLQYLSIDSCVNMEAILIDVFSDIKLPQLKRLVLGYLDSCKSFSSTPTGEAITLHLPSLESLEIEKCKELDNFWSGLIVAPKLQHVTVLECHNLKCFLPGNPNDNGDLQLPSLNVVNIAKSPNLNSFSVRPLVTPKLTHVQYDEKEYSMLLYGDLNDFLKKIKAA